MNGARSNVSAAGAQMEPSWADRRSASDGVEIEDGGGSGRRAARPWIVWLVVPLAVAAAMLPLFMLPWLPFRTPAGRTLLLIILLAWPLAVFIATGFFLRHVRPWGREAATSTPTRGEHAVNGLAGVLSGLAVYEIFVKTPRLPPWSWFCWAAIAVVMTIVALRSVPRAERHRMTAAVYGMIIALWVLFPVAIVPRGLQVVALALRTFVMLVILVLLIGAAAGGRHTRASPDPPKAG